VQVGEAAAGRCQRASASIDAANIDTASLFSVRVQRSHANLKLLASADQAAANVKQVPLFLRTLCGAPSSNLLQVGCAVQEIYVSRQNREQGLAALDAARVAWDALVLSCQQLESAATASASSEKQTGKAQAVAATAPHDARWIHECMSSVLTA
jgi:hypothetical protein